MVHIKIAPWFGWCGYEILNFVGSM